MSVGQRAVGAVLWSATQQTGGKVISFAVFIALSRLLDAPDFGVIAMASAAVGFLQLFATHGFGAALIQKQRLDGLDIDTAFWGGVMFNVLMFSVSILCAPLVAHLFSVPELEPVVRWLSLAFLFSALSQIPTALLQRDFAFKALAVRGLIAATVGGAAGIAMALSGFGVWSLVVKQLVGSAASVVLLWGQTAWRPRMRFSRAHFGDLFRFGFPLGLTSVVEFVAKRSDDILIGYFLGATVLGYYSIAYRLITILTEFCVKTINSVAWPFFARMQQNTNELRDAVYMAARGVGAITYPAFAFVAVAAPEIVHTVFGAKWESSVVLVQVLAFVGILNSQLPLFDSVMVAMGRTGWRLFGRFAIGVACVSGFAVAVNWGITAVAAAYVIGNYVIAPLFFVLAGRLVGLRPSTYFAQQWGLLVAAGGMAAVVVAVKTVVNAQPFGWLALAGYMLVASVSYVSLMRILAPTAYGEVRLHIGNIRARAAA